MKVETVALLCPGPSLPRYWDGGMTVDYDVVVGVNTVGHAYPVDWLAYADWHIVRRPVPPMPYVGTITKEAMRIPHLAWCDLQSAFPDAGITPPGLADGSTPRPKCGYTFPNALLWTLRYYPDAHIDIYGFDCAVCPNDFSGQSGDHSVNRWRRELVWLRAAWQPARITTHSEASPAVLEWLTAPAFAVDIPPPVPYSLASNQTSP